MEDLIDRDLILCRRVLISGISTVTITYGFAHSSAKMYWAPARAKVDGAADSQRL